MDYSDFEPQEMVEMVRLIEKATATAKRKQRPLMIEGAAEDDDAGT
jgi:hypothetical protein